MKSKLSSPDTKKLYSKLIIDSGIKKLKVLKCTWYNNENINIGVIFQWLSSVLCNGPSLPFIHLSTEADPVL
jgi:hypothetical protein